MNKTKITTALARIAIALMGTTAVTTTSEIAYARGGGGAVAVATKAWLR
jgi:hypothetical protein